jgi:hypothetical protein
MMEQHADEKADVQEQDGDTDDDHIPDGHSFFGLSRGVRKTKDRPIHIGGRTVTNGHVPLIPRSHLVGMDKKMLRRRAAAQGIPAMAIREASSMDGTEALIDLLAGSED